MASNGKQATSGFSKDLVCYDFPHCLFLSSHAGTYIPRKEVQIAGAIKAVVVKPNSAVKLRAMRACVDRTGVVRGAGEEWLVHTVGAYLPGIYEQIVEIVKARVLTDKVMTTDKRNKKQLHYS